MTIASWATDADGLTLDSSAGKIRVEVIDDSIIHVLHTRANQFGPQPSLIVLPQKPAGTWNVSDEPDAIVLRTTALQLRINRESAAFTWLDLAGNLLVSEPDTGGKHLEPIAVEKRIFDDGATIQTERTVDGLKARAQAAAVVVDRMAFSTKLDLVFSENEAIYGLGQHEEGILNYRGQSQYLYHQNLKVAMPVIVSTRGYGILWDTTSLAVFHDDVYGSYFWTEVDDEMDFYFVAGPEFDQIVAGFRKLTGKPTMLPRWTYGYIQSKERYRTQQELIDTVAEYRRREIPIDCIVQDWLTWTGKWWGDKNPDPERYPDPRGLVDNLHAMNAKLMVSIWPIMRGESPNQIEMREKKFLLGNDATCNAFDPDARALYWDQAERGWFRHGVDAWWCDCTEPFEADWKGALKPEPWKRAVINTNESKMYLDPEYINAYSMEHSLGIYEHQRRTTSSKRVVNLTRSGYPGQQRYGAITWSGDTAATWKTFRRQIADGLNFCVTGNPRWTCDIGAFFVAPKEQWFWRGEYPNGCDDPAYRELYVRWFQFGAFLPMFRSHGTDTPREVWRFGEKGEPFYDALVQSIQLRYRLLPYVYSIAARETLADDTMLRMLAFDFRSDPNVFNIDDQFMFGRALMVCPVTEPAVTEPGVDTRIVYLPAGCAWHDFWTGARYGGGQTISAAAPLNHVPLFVRAGSIIPLGPIVQHASEGLDQPLELRIYCGANGRFDLYEDENDSYHYETGAFATTAIEWNDASSGLMIRPRSGSFPNMPTNRRFNIVRVRPGHGAGIEPVASPDHMILNHGEV
jgi:alpha-D-xyloside xylohydrolase